MAYSARSLQPVIVSTVFVTFATFIVALRLYVRGIIVRKLGKEDWLALFTIFPSIGQTVTVFYQVKYGLGQHVTTLTPEQGLKSQEVLYFSILLYATALTSIKFSILSQYLQLFVRRTARVQAYILMGVVAIFGAFIILTSMLTCIPVERFWDSTQPGHCMNRRPLWFAHAAFNVCTDFAIMLLPMPTLWALQLPRKQKVTLVTIFGIGGVVCIISIIRIQTIDIATETKDPTYDTVNAAILSAVEVNTAIICASLPMLKPLAGRLCPQLWGSSSDPHSRPNYTLSGTGFTSSPKGPRMQLQSFHQPIPTTTRIVGVCPNAVLDVEKGKKDSGVNIGNERDIVMSTTIEQDIERRGDGDSERSLIIQQNR
ncbi:hypothetical protein PVAG01_08122 [Phlyctema vagabunda]|uniref:Rhodopsin domain-containing protein n=1 Tax=Phlyctema vagabunda TaxID=108571 RepID=A0ABR4P8L2_9HELO